MPSTGWRNAAPGIVLGMLIAVAGIAPSWAQGGMRARRGAQQTTQTPRLIVNGQPVGADVAPQTIGGTVMVPIRFVVQNLGGSVDWQPFTKEVRVYRGPQRLAMTIGSTRATQNGEGRALAAAPVIRGGRTLIPLREVSRFFGAQVQYNRETRQVFVSAPGGGAAVPESNPGGNP